MLYFTWSSFNISLPLMMNWFCGMVDWQKAFSLISSRDHCQRSSPLQISDTLRAGFEPVQNLSSGLNYWSCAVVITTTPWSHWDIEQDVCKILDNMCIVILCQPGCDVIKFEINLIFLIKPFFPATWPKSQDKNLNILRMKQAFKMKKRHFSSFLKGFYWCK